MRYKRASKEANSERQKNNEEYGKRKRGDKDNKKDGPPNKRHKKVELIICRCITVRDYH